jgi:hypothetical protein
VCESSLKRITIKSLDQGVARKVRVSMALHSGRHAVAIRDGMPLDHMEKLMSKLMSSLVAATIVGAFSMSAFAADAATSAPAAAEKPAAHKSTKSHTKHAARSHSKKAEAAQK